MAHLGGFKTTDNIKDAWGVENDRGIFPDRSALHTQIYNYLTTHIINRAGSKCHMSCSINTCWMWMCVWVCTYKMFACLICLGFIKNDCNLLVQKDLYKMVLLFDLFDQGIPKIKWKKKFVMKTDLYFLSLHFHSYAHGKNSRIKSITLISNIKFIS